MRFSRHDFSATVLLSVVLCVVAGSACVGTIGDDGAGAGAGPGSAGASPGSGGGKASEGGVPSAGAASGAGGDAGSSAGVLADTPIRWLTQTEYANTVRDLLYLPTAPDVSAVLPLDRASDVFDNVASLQDLTADAISDYANEAITLIGQVWAGGAPSSLVACSLADANASSCASTTVTAFAKRAWRRVPTSDEVTALLSLTQVAMANGDGLDMGVQLAFEAALTSPYFIFRVEIDPPGGGTHAVSPYELASRLSYLLWSSMPDDALFALADDGTLPQPAVLQAQVTRMMADPKASALVANFGTQWLSTFDSQTLGSAGVAPDPTLFPAFAAGDLRPAMEEEFTHYFGYFLATDGSFLDLVDAPFTFANPALASYYGVDGGGADYPQVNLDPTKRAGIVTQSGVLTLTSLPSRESITRRGKWILARLLCSPPPDPPPGVPGLGAVDAGAPLPDTATLRQEMASHRLVSPCKDCHEHTDPLGDALEHYDGIGAWRDLESTPGGLEPIDSSDNDTADSIGPFTDAVQMAHELRADPRVARCVAQQAYTYALGREPTSAADSAAIDQLNTTFASQGYRMKNLLTALVTSPAFQMRTGASQ